MGISFIELSGFNADVPHRKLTLHNLANQCIGIAGVQNAATFLVFDLVHAGQILNEFAHIRRRLR
ncbi:hypothetical protein D1872_346810 [compost metagenome]